MGCIWHLGPIPLIWKLNDLITLLKARDPLLDRVTWYVWRELEKIIKMHGKFWLILLIFSKGGSSWSSFWEHHQDCTSDPIWLQIKHIQYSYQTIQDQADQGDEYAQSSVNMGHLGFQPTKYSSALVSYHLFIRVVIQLWTCHWVDGNWDIHQC